MLTETDILNINAIKEESCRYKKLPERHNPFDLNRINFLVESQAYSPLLRKIITSYEDAAWHGKCETEQWRQHDKEIQIQRRKEQNKIHQRNFQLKKSQLNPEIEIARLKWKESIQQRTEAIKQWDTYVESLRHNYNLLKKS